MRQPEGSTDLWATVAKLREERHPQLPEALVKAILEAELASIEDRSRVLRTIQGLVDAHLSAEAEAG
ncbi:MAG: hypothetical protein KF809_14275 [Chloroflexi bacterium]|nr:hypothetical protein [Chloroflexota bacterium]